VSEQPQAYPFDVMFQQYLLALAVQDPTFLAANRACLHPEHFTDQGMRFVTKAILQFYDQYGQVPSHVSMGEWLGNVIRSGQHRDIAQRVIDLANFIYRVQVQNADYIKSRVVHFARWQGLRRAVLHGIQVLRKDGDPDDAMQMFNEALSLGVVQEGDEDLFSVATNLPQVWQNMVDGKGVIPTLFMPSFDRALHAGGPRRGEMYVVQGCPKSGKSQFLCQCGVSALAQGCKVLHVTIADLKQFDVEQRYLSRLTNTTMKKLLTIVASYNNSLRNLLLRPNQMRVKYYPPYSLTPSNLRSYMSWLQTAKDFKPDVLVIDYPDKMLYDRSDSYGEMGRIYMELQGILSDFGCVGWFASQSNRGASKEQLNTVGNVAESWDKIANADGIIPLTRLDKQGKEIKEATYEALDFDSREYTGELMAYVENVRFGYDGFQIKLHYDFSRSALMEVSPYARHVVDEYAASIETERGALQARQNEDMYRTGQQQWQK